MKRMKLTLAGRIVIFVLIAAILCGLGYTAVKFAPGLIENFGSDNLGNFTDDTNPGNNVDADKDTNKTDKPDNQTSGNKSNKVINLSLDEWIGWKPIIDANGGLTTQKGKFHSLHCLLSSVIFL